MNDERIDSLQGQVLALSMLINSIIPTLPPVSAAQAALSLKIEHETQRQEDPQEQTPAASMRSRDLIVESYLELLSSVARRG